MKTASPTISGQDGTSRRHALVVSGSTVLFPAPSWRASPVPPPVFTGEIQAIDVSGVVAGECRALVGSLLHPLSSNRASGWNNAQKFIDKTQGTCAVDREGRAVFAGNYQRSIALRRRKPGAPAIQRTTEQR